jgi:hypothetical protein
MKQAPHRGKPRVVFATPLWNISGVNTFTETLMRGLAQRGFEVELLFTQQGIDRERLPDVPHRFLDDALPGTGGPWSADRWSRIIRYLSEAAPCIFVPGYDYFASAVSPALPHDVGILGIVHSDDYEHYDHAERLGRYWNGIVGVSERCYERTLALNRGFKPITWHIPYGIHLPTGFVRAPRGPKAPLRIIWSGRLEQTQKNVLAIPGLVRELEALGFAYVLTLAGDGAAEAELRDALRQELESGRVRMPGRLTLAQVQTELQRSDVFLLVSFFEGLPVSMLDWCARA